MDRQTKRCTVAC